VEERESEIRLQNQHRGCWIGREVQVQDDMKGEQSVIWGVEGSDVRCSSLVVEAVSCLPLSIHYPSRGALGPHQCHKKLHLIRVFITPVNALSQRSRSNETPTSAASSGHVP